jgi:hypothetical protein
MRQRRHQHRIFLGLCLLDLVIALVLVTQVGRYTRAARTQDLARVLACAARPSDTVYVSGAYPYDLPFYAQTVQPMVVLEDWPARRSKPGDGWQQELADAAGFAAGAAALLQAPEALAGAGSRPGNWWVVRTPTPGAVQLGDWVLHFQGAGWALYLSAGGAEAAAPATAKGLAGCPQAR